jgi:hypothetical protein
MVLMSLVPSPGAPSARLRLGDRCVLRGGSGKELQDPSGLGAVEDGAAPVALLGAEGQRDAMHQEHEDDCQLQWRPLAISRTPYA